MAHINETRRKLTDYSGNVPEGQYFLTSDLDTAGVTWQERILYFEQGPDGDSWRMLTLQEWDEVWKARSLLLLNLE